MNNYKILARLNSEEIRRLKTTIAKVQTIHVTSGVGFSREEMETTFLQEFDLKTELLQKHNIEIAPEDTIYFDPIAGQIIAQKLEE